MALRILIAAGGTVGHVAPALAVADELRAALDAEADRGTGIAEFGGGEQRADQREAHLLFVGALEHFVENG